MTSLPEATAVAATFDSPLGRLRAEATQVGIRRLDFMDDSHRDPLDTRTTGVPPVSVRSTETERESVDVHADAARRAGHCSAETPPLRPEGPAVRCRGWSESSSGTPGKTVIVIEPRRGDRVSHEHLNRPITDPANVNTPTAHEQAARQHLESLRNELAAYFAGTLRVFTTPLTTTGTPFQHRVWNELRSIPHAETISYATLAHRLADPHATRAVARANAQNPIAVLIPCHRVIGKDGTLTGYAGGLHRKQALLELEGVHTLFAQSR